MPVKMSQRPFQVRAGVLACLIGPLIAMGEPAPGLLDEERIREAVGRSLQLLEYSGAFAMEQRACFSCHHGSNPATAAAIGWARGIEPDLEGFKTQLRRTYDQLARDVERLRQARFAGGQADAPGHALWFLAVAGWPKDAVTGAATDFLAGHEADSNHWSSELNRPPTVGSPFTTTYVVARALKHYGSPAQKTMVERRLAGARAWLVATPAEDTEDSVYRLRGLHLLGAMEAVPDAAAQLLAGQRDDGAWAQRALMKTDAYATGTALAALIDTGVLKPTDLAFRRGADFLLRTQEKDGSWQVTSRARQVQPFFQSGFPHGVNQFISTAATSWAGYALLRSLPESQDRQGRRYLDDKADLVTEIRSSLAPIEYSEEQLGFFKNKVEPVLRERCYSCHSERAKKLKGGLHLDDPARLLSGGDSGPPVVPGDPGRSLLIRSLQGDVGEDLSRMPPKKPLAEAEIENLRRWVAMGAPMPSIKGPH
jgi:hypothetical protein